MANLDLTAQIPCEIDHSFALTCTRITRRATVPSVFKAGALGPIGIAQGIGPVSVTLTFAIPKGGMEFSIDDIKKKGKGVTITFTYAGTEKRLAVGCKLTDDDMNNDPAAGNAEWSWTFMGVEDVAG
jgi:hypothetical protein